MRDEPVFKLLKGYPALFRVRASRCPFDLLLRETSLGACGKLANLFNRGQGISSILESIWCARSFPQVAVLKVMFLWS